MLGVSPAVIRAAFVVFAFANGIGALAYFVAWMISSSPDPADRDIDHVPGASTAQYVGLGIGFFGTLLLLRALGIWSSDAVVWPITLAGLGSAVVSSRPADAQSASRTSVALGRPTLPTWWQSLAGAGLIAAGMFGALVVNVDLADLGNALLTVAVATAGVLLLLGPWLTGVVAAGREERRQRIRTTTHAELAAHLHDSVLQTLALIQRNADRPTRMVTLARRQERELRAWLYGDGALGGRGVGEDEVPSTLAAAVDAIVADVEEDHEISVDAVVVGHLTPDADVLEALRAVREAMVNAARHAGVGRIDLYVEADTESLEAFVRDRGRGFDQSTVGPGQRGLRDSIRGRMARLGGSATITSTPDVGTEVEIRLPRNPTNQPHDRSAT